MLVVRHALVVALCMASATTVMAQSAPSASERAGFNALQQAAHEGDIDTLIAEVDAGADIEARDAAGRTPAIIAAFASHDEVVKRLAAAGADLDALESRAYDIVTIAAVADDLAMLDLALELGADSGQVTSPYDGTALIAAAHLGHHAVVRSLIEAGAPLDHINNLDWTALIEAVVLGDGGPDHIETVRALVDAGADRSIGDSAGITPLQHARQRGYAEIVSLLEED